MEFIKSIIKNRKLIFQLGKNDFRNRFANTTLGSLWGFLQPFVFMATYVIVFQYIFKTPGPENAPYIVWFLPGMAMWQALNDGILSASSSIRTYSYLVKKVVFPVDVIPIISIIWICTKCITINIYNNISICIYDCIYEVNISNNNISTRFFPITNNINATIFLVYTSCLEHKYACRTSYNIKNIAM